MDNPTQTLLHITSLGENVRTQVHGNVGSFINETKQPINNVNKFGLLHYSIPKMLDHVDDGNRIFTLQFRFANYLYGNTFTYVNVGVRLPRMDYYRMMADDMGAFDEPHASFCEVLQTSINWAIQKQWQKNSVQHNYAASLTAPWAGLGPALSNRLGCVVRMREGNIEMVFGYRGHLRAVTQDDINALTEAAVGPLGSKIVEIESGTPYPNTFSPRRADTNEPAVLASPDNTHSWFTPNGFPHKTVTVGATTDHLRAGAELRTVVVSGLSPRMQQMLGQAGAGILYSSKARVLSTNPATAATETLDAQVISRGRIALVNYVKGGQANQSLNSGMISCLMTLTPNPFAPSFLFLQLSTQGTKSKVLGHNAERGGWAVPTSANQFVSQWDNFPGYDTDHQNPQSYRVSQVRNVPALLNLTDDHIEQDLPGPPARTNVPRCNFYRETVDDDGAVGLPQALRFDPPAYGENEIAYQDGGNGAAQITIYEHDNWSLVHVPTARGSNDAASAYTPSPLQPQQNHRFGSRFIHFGDMINGDAMAKKQPMTVKAYGGLAQGGVASSPAFTVSMVNPNWLYTDVPNSTLQTIDVQMMWGDTSKNVVAVSGIPCQYSIIASQ